MNKTLKPKLNIQEQVEHLKSKGITFTIKNEKEVITFLTNNSYYFKLKSYCKNYQKKQDGTYINLDFAYLQELSTLDMYFRRLSIRLTLDIEHILKTKIIRDFNSNLDCDGYEIINEYLKENTRLKNELSNFKCTGYTAKDNIIKKYKTDLAIWNFIEIIEFGKFLEFCNFYYEKYYDETYNKIKKMLWSVKCLRNSSAHNNCLLHNLKPLEHAKFKRNWDITKLMIQNVKMGKKNIEKKLQIPTIHDFITSLIVFEYILNSKEMKKGFHRELNALLKIRFRKNETFFKSNSLLTSNYIFLRKAIHSLKKI